MINLWDRKEDVPYFIEKYKQEIPALHEYILETKEPHSAVLICPGGGYSFVSMDNEGHPVARWLNSIGISAFVLNYRVDPYDHNSQICDVTRAMKYIRLNAKTWNIDIKKIGIIGFSAGGHLASTISTHYELHNRRADNELDKQSSRPDFTILCYPVITLGKKTHFGSKRVFCGKERRNPEFLEMYSNELHVTRLTPPTFIWHTANDHVVSVENSFLYASALSKHHVPFQLEIYPKGKHGLGLAKDEPFVSDWTRACEKWLKDSGYLV